MGVVTFRIIFGDFFWIFLALKGNEFKFLFSSNKAILKLVALECKTRNRPF